MTSTTKDQEGILWKRKGRKNHQNQNQNQMEEEEEDMKFSKSSSKDEKKNKTDEKKRYELVTYRELPEYMKDNEYILGHYRADWPINVAFFSLFRWHNETLNIWTHLIGFLMFLWLTITNLMQMPQLSDLLGKFTRSFPIITPGTNASLNTSFFQRMEVPIDMGMTTSTEMPVTQWPFFVFLAGSMFCLFTSSTCHLFCCHSHRLNLLLLRFDYVGIAVMIITSFFPPIFYIFQCQPHWQFFYLAGITTMGVFTIINLLTPALSTNKFRVYRALLFFTMGFSGIVPAIHALILNWSEPQRFLTVTYETAMALSYATGTLFYVSRIPERWKPGWFDLAGHSHQIFHIFVIFGALSHYYAALVFMDWRREVECN